MSENSSEISSVSSEKPAMSIFDNPNEEQRERNKKAYRGLTGKTNKPKGKKGRKS